MLSSALLEMDEEDVDDKDEDIADDDPVLNQIKPNKQTMKTYRKVVLYYNI
jgi:hypothetical protein